MIWRMLGKVTGPTATMLGAQYVKSALQADYRVASVKSSVATASGDAILVTATAEAIAGGSVDLGVNTGS